MGLPEPALSAYLDAHIGLSLLGAYLVMGGDLSLAFLNLGDVMALIAGVSWAIGATLIFTGPTPKTSSLMLATVVWATLQSLAFALIMGETLGPQAGPGVIGISLILGALYLVPLLGLTLWGATRLPPALLSFPFTLEIVSGVISGALLLDEPFGMYRLAGGLLVFGTAMFEAFITLRTQAVPKAPVAPKAKRLIRNWLSEFSRL